jgi:hypothetical protein
VTDLKGPDKGDLTGLAQINVQLSVFFAGISGSSTADAASQGKIFIEAHKGRLRSFVFDCDHRGFCSAGRDHSAVDPDGRLGRSVVGVYRRALSRGRLTACA